MMNILHRDSLPRGGFAGLTETRLIKDQQIGGDKATWDGLGQFVYLADAKYLPYGETHMHPHREIDVITILLEGRLTHEGSMEHGKSMVANQAQVQRAGGEGFQHNEINPDESSTRLLQLWALPETAGEPAGYKIYATDQGGLQKIYGGKKDQESTFDSSTAIETGVLKKGETVNHRGEFLAYITNGNAVVNGKQVTDGDLIQGDELALEVTSEEVQVTLITLEADRS